MSSVPRAPCPLIPNVPCALHVLVPCVPRILPALMVYLALFLCILLSHVPPALRPLVPHAPCLLCVLVPPILVSHVPCALCVVMFNETFFVLVPYTLSTPYADIIFCTFEMSCLLSYDSVQFFSGKFTQVRTNIVYIV